LKQADLDHFEEALRKERSRALADLGAHASNHDRTPRESAGDLSAYSMHMADQASDSMEREKSFYFTDVGNKALNEIEDALKRLGDGVYGACLGCSREIPRERLEAMPQTRLCIDCQEREERGEVVEH